MTWRTKRKRRRAWAERRRRQQKKATRKRNWKAEKSNNNNQKDSANQEGELFGKENRRGKKQNKRKTKRGPSPFRRRSLVAVPGAMETPIRRAQLKALRVTGPRTGPLMTDQPLFFSLFFLSWFHRMQMRRRSSEPICKFPLGSSHLICKSGRPSKRGGPFPPTNEISLSFSSSCSSLLVVFFCFFF